MIILNYEELLTHSTSLIRELARYLMKSSLPYQLKFNWISIQAPNDVGVFTLKLQGSSIYWEVWEGTEWLEIHSIASHHLIDEFKDIEQALNFKVQIPYLCKCCSPQFKHEI